MAMREMLALVEQVNALKELIMQRIVREKLPRRNEATMRQEVPAKTTNSNRAEEKGDRRGSGRPVKAPNVTQPSTKGRGKGHCLQEMPKVTPGPEWWAGKKRRPTERRKDRMPSYNNDNKACNQGQQAQSRGRTKQKGTTRKTG